MLMLRIGRKSLSRLEKLAILNHEAIVSSSSGGQARTAKSTQQIISCGENLSRLGSKQLQLLDTLDAAVEEVKLTNETGMMHQLYAEKKAEVRATQNENLLTELTCTTEGLQ